MSTTEQQTKSEPRNVPGLYNALTFAGKEAIIGDTKVIYVLRVNPSYLPHGRCVLNGFPRERIESELKAWRDLWSPGAEMDFSGMDVSDKLKS